MHSAEQVDPGACGRLVPDLADPIPPRVDPVTPSAGSSDCEASNPLAETDEQTIARLAALSAVEYDRVREKEAKRLKVRVATLDRQVADARGGKDDQEPDASEDAEADGEFEQTVTRLASLPPHKYDRKRAAEAKRLSVRSEILDGAVKTARSAAGGDLQGRALELPKVEPWTDPVDGAALLDDTSDLIGRYVAMPGPLADAVALWTIATWLHCRLELSTFLNVTSPTKRCGKSLLMETIAELVYRPMPLSGRVTPAALFRSIQSYGPTLLLDEADTYFNEDPELRGVVNGSQRRDLAHVLRCVGDEHEPRRFTTWCPKAISGIGGLPDTVLDRALVIRLERRPGNIPTLPRWRDRDKTAIGQLRRRVARWIADHAEAILAARNSIRFLSGLNDRACDAWEALLAIAHVAGGEWTARASQACEAITGDSEDETGAREKLIADLRKVFEDASDPDALPTIQILENLHAIEGRPWSEWRRGKPLSPRGLSDLLKPFKVQPKTFRQPSGGTPKGYRRQDLEPIWSAYLLDRGPRSATP